MRASIVTLLLAGCGALPSAAEADAAYARALAASVRPNGIDYAALRRRPADLDRFLARAARALPSFVDGEDRKGWFIDLYNACVLDLVVRHPSLRSIRDLGDPFGVPRCLVAGRLRSLDEIERAELRATGDARVHVALVCASRGCPDLARAPWRGPDLSSRLDAAARRFLADPTKAHREGPRLAVSHLFAPDWLGPDFEKQAGSVRAWIERYAPTEIAEAARAGAELFWLDYDWSLNEAR